MLPDRGRIKYKNFPQMIMIPNLSIGGNIDQVFTLPLLEDEDDFIIELTPREASGEGLFH